MGTVNPRSRGERVRAEQIRLLYVHSNLSSFVTVLAAGLLAFLQRGATPRRILVSWLLYMIVVAAARSFLGFRYQAVSSNRAGIETWSRLFTIGAGLAGIGWGAAGVLLYPEGQIVNQVFLAFILGGMMLGAGSLLASRPEAFLVFLIPTGIPIAIRFVLQGDDEHLAMGLLAAVFIGATLITTWRIYKTIVDSLTLRFENETLLADLRLAKDEAEVLNQQLEHRVRERTAELHDANNRLRAEMEQRIQIEEELLRARKLESLGVLAGGIAHDFNNFLTILQGSIGLARSRLEPGTPVSGILDEAASACGRASSLAQQLLTFGKGGAPVRRVVSVSRLLEDTVSLARAGAPTSIHLEIENGLWAAEIDPSQISHALCNILVNARQAMPEHGEITMRAENFIAEPGMTSLPAGNYLKIAVRDQGCGIAPENLSRVFDPYFTTKPTGNGLGLATTHAIVTKHQGLITVESTVGVETTFTIFLPASEQAPAPVEPAAESLQRGAGRILVMDDEPIIRKLLVEILQRLGYEVECASDGSEAIACYQKAKAAGQRFDAVLLDLTVPGGMGGLEATIKLKEIDPSPKFIVSSGYSEAPVISEFHKYGFDAVLAKPWTAVQVSELLRQILGNPPLM